MLSVCLWNGYLQGWVCFFQSSCCSQASRSSSCDSYINVHWDCAAAQHHRPGCRASGAPQAVRGRSCVAPHAFCLWSVLHDWCAGRFWWERVGGIRGAGRIRALARSAAARQYRPRTRHKGCRYSCVGCLVPQLLLPTHPTFRTSRTQLYTSQQLPTTSRHKLAQRKLTRPNATLHSAYADT